MSRSVNFLWNYCNEISQKAFRRDKKFLSGYDLNTLTSGTSQDLFLHSQTVQKVCEEYALRRKITKRVKLNWRSKKRSRGWIPFKKSGIKVEAQGDQIRYKGRSFRFWKSREIQGDIKEGSFSQDCCGRWYVNFQCEVPEAQEIPNGVEDIGIDLGLKTQLTCSNGKKFLRDNLTKRYQKDLGRVQRSGKKHQVSKIHQKIKNVRKDWNHKVSTEIAKNFKGVFVGDVSSKKLSKTKMAKSVYDASWGQLRSSLKYKAQKLGRMYQDVKEMFSSCRCSDCLQKTGPKGLRQLGVREWVCGNCGSLHDRDINAAKNILRLGHQTLIKGIPGIYAGEDVKSSTFSWCLGGAS